MHEATFEVRIPAELLEFGLEQQDVQSHVIEWLVLSLFQDERISSGRAAKLLNMNRGNFLILLRQRGINYIDFTTDELTDEFAAIDTLQVKVTP